MYERFYDLRERPFSLSPDPDYLYLSPVHAEALSYLRYGLEGHAGFTVLTGEIGSGKTTLLQTVLRGLDHQTSVSRIVNTLLDPHELVEAVLLDFGLEARIDGSKPHLLRELARFLITERHASRLALLVIDEAQNLSLATLEEVRMLSNLETEKSKLLQIVLVGQPSLRDTLARPELQQLRQRVAVSYHLGALEPADTAAYIRHRMRRASIGAPVEFPNPVVELVHHHSGGLPRTINLIADAILLFGYGEGQRHLTVDLASTTIAELEATGVIAPATHPRRTIVEPPVPPSLADGTVSRPVAPPAKAAESAVAPARPAEARGADATRQHRAPTTAAPAIPKRPEAPSPRGNASHGARSVGATAPAAAVLRPETITLDRGAQLPMPNRRSPMRTVAAFGATLVAGLAVIAIALIGVNPVRRATNRSGDVTTPSDSASVPGTASPDVGPGLPVPFVGPLLDTAQPNRLARGAASIERPSTGQQPRRGLAPQIQRSAASPASSARPPAPPSRSPSNAGRRPLTPPPSRPSPSPAPPVSPRNEAAPRPPSGRESVAAAAPTLPAPSNARGSVPQAPATAPASPTVSQPVAAPPAAAETSVAPAAPVARSASPSVPPADDSSVRAVLNQYRNAYSRLDVPAAKAVWPSVNNRALSRAFGSLQSQELNFSSCQISVSGNRAVASCGGHARYVPRVGSQTVRSEPRQWTFDLRKNDDRWTIAAVETR